MDQKLTTKPFCGFTQKLGVLTPYDPQKTHLRFTINNMNICPRLCDVLFVLAPNRLDVKKSKRPKIRGSLFELL